MLSILRKSKFAANFILMIFAFSLIGAAPLPAQERYPAAAVARLSFISGPVTYSRGDDPDEWDDAVENVPLTIGDRIYAPEDGRAELQLSSGNFIRLAPRSYLSALNLSDDIKQFYLGEGAASFNIRHLQSDEVIEIDTPNVSVTLDEPGRYRVAVDEDGNSRITVRRGKVIVAASGRQLAVENSEIRVYGIDSPRYEIVGLPQTDAFDRWVSERDDRFERAYSDAYRYASDDIIGVEDLVEYGRWEEIPEYGYAWTPSRVAAGWAPFSAGRWYWQDPWGWTWISNERWGWATSHYGRWTPYRSRWYWVPVRPRTRVRYAPACVEFVRIRDHVGWFPLHPRDRHIPWWERRDRQRDRQHITYVNRNYVTVINHNHFVSAQPVHRHIIRESVIVQEARSTRLTSDSLPIPNRSSLRLLSENGGRRGLRPSADVLNRAAVVRTALPGAPRAFQEKLPEIQKNQGRAVEPARIVAVTPDNRATARVRVRPAAETGRGDFAPRNPGASSGPPPQPLTAARGKKLAAGENSGANKVSAPVDRGQEPPAPQQSSRPEPSKGTASRPESPRLEQERDRQRQKIPAPERQRSGQTQQQDLDKKNPAMQKEEERKAQPQKQSAQEQGRQEPEKRQSPQQRLEELERRQTQQTAEERKAQQNRQDQERREQLKQQQLQERQARQQRQQELERRRQQQQEQAHREQLKQQQLQERQARDQQHREQQRQQEVERRQQQQQREQERQEQQARAQQVRQQQLQQQRETRQPQGQQEQKRTQQPRQQQRPASQPPELQRPPAQP